MKREYELEARHDARASFYGKAIVEVDDDGIERLYSYGTHVATYYPKNDSVVVYGWHSQTTGRHINEFIQQFGFDKMTKAEMEADE